MQHHSTVICHIEISQHLLPIGCHPINRRYLSTLCELHPSRLPVIPSMYRGQFHITRLGVSLPMNTPLGLFKAFLDTLLLFLLSGFACLNLWIEIGRASCSEIV